MLNGVLYGKLLTSAGELAGAFVGRPVQVPNVEQVLVSHAVLQKLLLKDNSNSSKVREDTR
jgi:hypothetical protein